MIVLTSLGERMSNEDVDELLKGVDTKDGRLNYAGGLTAMYLLTIDFVHMILSN